MTPHERRPAKKLQEKTRNAPTLAQLTAWKEQIIDDAIGWHRSLNKIPENELEAFRAGAEQGIGNMLATLRLHGVLPS